jgi:hypothetical protein
VAYNRGGLPHGLDTFERAFYSAPINSGVPVLDQDINLMQRIQADRLADLYSCLYCCGWLTISQPDPLVDYINKGINNFEITNTPHLFSCFGICTQYAESFTEFNRITITSTNTPPDPVFDDSSGCPPGPPGPSTHGDDLVFIEFWYEEVRDTDIIYRYGNVDHYNTSHFSNDIIEPAIGDPAAVRLQLRYRTRIVAGADSMDDLNVYIQGKHSTPDTIRRFTFDPENNIWFHDTTTSTTVGNFDDLSGVVYATPFVHISRTIGDDDLNNATFNDLRTAACHKVSEFGPPSGSSCFLSFPGTIYSPEVTDIVSGNAVTIDFCEGNVHAVDLAPASGDVTITLNNPVAGAVYFVSFKQHPTTPVDVIWPGDVDFVLNFTQQVSQIPGDTDVFMMIRTSNPSYRAIGFGGEASEEPPCQQDLTVVGGTASIDFDICASWRLFLQSADNPFTINLSNGVSGGVYAIKFLQGSIAGKQPIWPSNVTWLNQTNTQEDLSESVNGIDIVTLYFDGIDFCAKTTGQSGSGSTYLHLGDTTDTDYSGKSEFIPRVNVFEDELELVSPSTIGSSIDLDDLSDVVITSPIADNILQWDGSKWINSTLDVDELSTTGASFCDILKFNGVTWGPDTLSIDDLNDVDTTGVVNGDYLRFNGSSGNWEPSPT